MKEITLVGLKVSRTFLSEIEILRKLPHELRSSTKSLVKYSIMEGLPRESKAQGQPPQEL